MIYSVGCWNILLYSRQIWKDYGASPADECDGSKYIDWSMKDVDIWHIHIFQEYWLKNDCLRDDGTLRSV